MTLRPIAPHDVGVGKVVRDGRIWPAGSSDTATGLGLGSVVYHLLSAIVSVSWARLGKLARSGVMESHANPRTRIS